MRTKEVIESLELELQTVVSCHLVGEANLGPLQEQQVLLTTQPPVVML